jgi:hypothetical protein
MNGSPAVVSIVCACHGRVPLRRWYEKRSAYVEQRSCQRLNREKAALSPPSAPRRIRSNPVPRRTGETLCVSPSLVRRATKPTARTPRRSVAALSGCGPGQRGRWFTLCVSGAKNRCVVLCVGVQNVCSRGMVARISELTMLYLCYFSGMGREKRIELCN